MAHELIVTAGPEKGRVFELSESDSLTLGRSQTAPLQINDPHCSRQHCQLRIENGAIIVTDNNSTGGTYINGAKITEQALGVNDTLRIGESELKIKSDAPESAKTLPPVSPQSTMTKEDLPKLVGQTVGNYLIEKQLSRGTTGMVFLAKDTQKGIPVALKVMNPELATNEEEMQRFIRGMKTMLPLKHPNLIQIYAAGKTGGLCWISMEYVEGESMTQVIERVGVAGMLGWQYGLQVAIHVGRALEYAQEHQIIHRNIAPANILIRQEDKVVKLGDMMLAKALEGTQAKNITAAGQRVGDVHYMSPERASGSTDIDGRSDIYGLGATVYALVTGRPPFEGGSVVETIMKIMNEQPKPPREHQLSIPGQFEGIIMKMLAKRPDDRYQNAKEMLKELEWVAKLNGVKC